jgi:integrase
VRTMSVKVKEWKGAWWIFINHHGTRKAKRIGVGASGKKAAQHVAQQIQARLAIGQPAFEPKPTTVAVESYAETFLERIEHTRKHTTHDGYRKILDHDILPVFRGQPLQAITRERVKGLATDCLRRGLTPKTVQNIIRCFSSLLSHAVEDNLISVNPALRPGKFLPKISKRRRLDPLTRQELAQFLAHSKAVAPALYPLFLCAARTGLRQGELLALQWDDVNLAGRFLGVCRNFTHGRLTTPKSGESRRVDLSRELTATLEALQLDRQLDAATRGQDAAPPWVFCDPQGKPFHQNWVRLRFFRLLKGAGVRQVRFHDLRHTFASLLLQNGESPVYVKEQMGHCSIQVTVDLYGHLIPGGNTQAVDRLDFVLAERPLKPESATPAQPAPVFPRGVSPDRLQSPIVTRKGHGVDDGFRTRDLRIHNPAL